MISGIIPTISVMIKCSQGDVVLIPFPFTDLTTFKQRPALILSSNSFNSRNQDVIVVAITSHIPDQLPEDSFLLISSDLERAGLPKKSLVKLGKIVTIDQRLVRKKLGALPPVTLSKILIPLQSIFGIV